MARVPEVLIIDQDKQGRFDIKHLVKQAQLGFAGEAGLGTEAVSLASEVTPDVIFCGIGLPPERSLRTIEALLDVLPETPVIAYARKDAAEVVRQSMLAGARDFLIIPAKVERVIESIQSVLESEERKRLRLSGQSKSLGPKGLVVTVFGAKGGVGKTTVATNLGVALASNLGQSVVLVDADNSFGDVADMLELPADRDLVEFVREFETLERGNVDEFLLKHDSGLWVLPAPRDALKWRGVTPDNLRAIVHLLASRFDIVLIDTAAMLSDLSLAVLEEASMVLWVTSTDFSSINNSLSGFESLQQISYPDGRIRLVLNVTSSDDGVRPAKIEEVLKREFFWTVPYDNRVRVGSQIGKPAILASPNSPGSKSLLQLAQAVTGGDPTAGGPTNKKTKISWPFRRQQAPSSVQTAEGA